MSIGNLASKRRYDLTAARVGLHLVLGIRIIVESKKSSVIVAPLFNDRSSILLDLEDSFTSTTCSLVRIEVVGSRWIQSCWNNNFSFFSGLGIFHWVSIDELLLRAHYIPFHTSINDQFGGVWINRQPVDRSFNDWLIQEIWDIVDWSPSSLISWIERSPDGSQSVSRINRRRSWSCRRSSRTIDVLEIVWSSVRVGSEWIEEGCHIEPRWLVLKKQEGSSCRSRFHCCSTRE